ncbi:unnamed protein product [Staurois parvus]|uniref:Uncharacterized protein n=1 Tax=Staurois parvus TaxID=386267 RepID=A0ABN9BL38_9NEOB|nr:unnamed protein product [Staurois parvus]
MRKRQSIFNVSLRT